ncbi:MAG: AsnC family transcriptional regulator [Runella slithyformis]|nr:MAG: AsnC family transcriptional regulator [Runella slithyformis]TAF93757.1 MAG: AsnC family transcriptional regulator [Runella sp.]TAG24390.1 MAG: AsnC family transcriptional regulator [Cytophagales bacterium]TAG36428.1 MAG: AsnC family transcriptional regulator [Cytophagia bacterium]TAF01593.1 MAG: AsnC family transcriptional regulator [Runella slithyformis]
MKEELDSFDIQILQELERDGRKAYASIADTLQISNTMVHQRVARLRRIGVLKGASILLDERKLGYEWSAFTGVTLKEDSNSAQIIEALRAIPEVTECYYITGQYTLYLRIVALSNEHMRRILYDKIDHIAGVLKTETMIDFGAAFKRNAPIVAINED